MNNKYCTLIEQGIFVSHRGISYCCSNKNKQLQISPLDFWNSVNRSIDFSKMNTNKSVLGCDVCYLTEANKMPSERIFANRLYSKNNINLPKIIEIDFSNLCNLKCIMCDSNRSSEWAKDEGKTVSNIRREYIDDLIKISNNLTHLTVHGGEPTIISQYEYYFEELEKIGIINNISLQVITNATNINKKFYELLGKFKNVRLGISIDAYGKANDYIRWPSKFFQIEKNLLAISDLKENIEVEVLNTINLLSMLNYDEFLNWAKKIENHYNKKGKIFKLIPMKIQFPKEYSPFYAPEQLKNKFISDIKEFTKKNSSIYNSNWKTEILLIAKQIEKSKFDNSIFEIFKKKINFLNSQRKIEEITDFFPTYYDFF